MGNFKYLLMLTTITVNLSIEFNQKIKIFKNLPVKSVFIDISTDSDK